MGDVINLNQYRKKRRRDEKSQKSSTNRVRFGRVKADKDLATARAAKEAHSLDLKKREPIPFERPEAEIEQEHNDQDESDPV